MSKVSLSLIVIIFILMIYIITYRGTYKFGILTTEDKQELCLGNSFSYVNNIFQHSLEEGYMDTENLNSFRYVGNKLKDCSGILTMYFDRRNIMRGIVLTSYDCSNLIELEKNIKSSILKNFRKKDSIFIQKSLNTGILNSDKVIINIKKYSDTDISYICFFKESYQEYKSYYH